MFSLNASHASDVSVLHDVSSLFPRAVKRHTGMRQTMRKLKELQVSNFLEFFQLSDLNEIQSKNDMHELLLYRLYLLIQKRDSIVTTFEVNHWTPFNFLH